MAKRRGFNPSDPKGQYDNLNDYRLKQTGRHYQIDVTINHLRQLAHETEDAAGALELAKGTVHEQDAQTAADESKGALRALMTLLGTYITQRRDSV